MPFQVDDLQRLAHLSRLERELTRSGERVLWDLSQAALAIQTSSESVHVKAEIVQGPWFYAWGRWPWCRVEALREDAAARVIQGVRG